LKFIQRWNVFELMKALDRFTPRDESTRSITAQADSHVRSRSYAEGSRAPRRVAEYLRALGLCDAGRVESLADELSAGAETPEAAVALAQSRVDAFRTAVFGADADSIDPLWMRAFITSCPDAFLADPEIAREAAAKFGDPRAGRAPAKERFRDQTLRALRVPRWVWGISAAGVVTTAASVALLHELRADGLLVAEFAWVALFAFLFGCAALGCVTAVVGFFASIASLVRRSRQASEPSRAAGAAQSEQLSAEQLATPSDSPVSLVLPPSAEAVPMLPPRRS